MTESDEIWFGNIWDRNVFLGGQSRSGRKRAGPQIPQNFLGTPTYAQTFRPGSTKFGITLGGVACFYTASTTPPFHGGWGGAGPASPSQKNFFFGYLLHARAQYENSATKFCIGARKNFLHVRPATRVVRIDPLRFLAGCRKRRLNQALSVLSLSLGFL